MTQNDDARVSLVIKQAQAGWSGEDDPQQHLEAYRGLSRTLGECIHTAIAITRNGTVGLLPITTFYEDEETKAIFAGIAPGMAQAVDAAVVYAFLPVDTHLVPADHPQRKQVELGEVDATEVGQSVHAIAFEEHRPGKPVKTVLYRRLASGEFHTIPLLPPLEHYDSEVLYFPPDGLSA